MLKSNQVVLQDAFQREVGIGDIVLGAKGKRSNYQETVYMHSIVIGRTRAMVRLHQIGSYDISKSNVLDSIEGRYGRGGGKVLPVEIILVHKDFLSEQEITDAVARGVTAHTPSAAAFLTPASLTPAPKTQQPLIPLSRLKHMNSVGTTRASTPLSKRVFP